MPAKRKDEPGTPAGKATGAVSKGKTPKATDPKATDPNLMTGAGKAPTPKGKAAETAGTAAESPTGRSTLLGDAVGSEAAYAKFLPAAQKIPAHEVPAYRLDPVLAYHNVQGALAQLAPHRDALKKALPLLDHTAMFAAGELAQAVIFAATQVEGPAKSLGDLAKQLAEASKLRGLLLSTAEALVLSGTFKAAAVAKIRAGRGPIDAARDLVELAALYGKTPESLKEQRMVRAEHLKAASALGTELLGRLEPGDARKKAGPRPDADAVKNRDQLAALLWKTFQDLRRAGYYLWGDDLETHLPALQTRARPKPQKPPVPVPA